MKLPTRANVTRVERGSGPRDRVAAGILRGFGVAGLGCVGLTASSAGTPLPGRGRLLVAHRAEFDLMFAARRGLMSAGLAGPLDVPAAAEGH